jgi:hypothetical protein
VCYNKAVKLAIQAVLLGILLLLVACQGPAPAPVATATSVSLPAASPAAPSDTPGTTISVPVPPTADPETLPSGQPDILALLPAGNQPLAVVPSDLDGDGHMEWVVLAGKTGQPAFETVLPLVIAARPGGFQIVWRGQVDFSVAASGNLQVLDLTGDGHPEILYQNATPAGGVYAFVYSGSAQVDQHPSLRPQGGACAGLDYFCGWTLEIGAPAGSQPRPLISLINRTGARQYYRWSGTALAAAETVTGTPWPADRPTPPVTRPPDPANVDVAQGEGTLTVIARLTADLDGDGVPEIAITYQLAGQDRLRLAIFAFGAPPGQPDGYHMVWSAGPLAGTDNQVFKVRDLTGDGRPELLSGQGGGDTGGGTLYVVGRVGDGYGLLRPEGGPLAGRDSFGAGDYEVQVQTGNKPPLILAHSGPGASQIDRYGWQDGALRYQTGK